MNIANNVTPHPFKIYFNISLPYTFGSSATDSSSSVSRTGLSSLAAQQIGLIHLFLGRPRLLFWVDSYDSIHNLQRLQSIRVISLCSLCCLCIRVTWRQLLQRQRIAGLYKQFSLTVPRNAYGTFIVLFICV